MPAEHGIVGEDYGIDLPETNQDEALLIEEQKLAKFSKTREYRRLKEHLEQRIDYYQTFLPSGEPIAGVKPEELAKSWLVANAIIAEFRAVIATYEGAREVVSDAGRSNS